MKINPNVSKNINEALKSTHSKDHKIVVIDGDAIVEDEVLTDEEIEGMQGKYLAFYNRYLDDAKLFREKIYKDLFYVARFFCIFRESIDETVKDRDIYDLAMLQGNNEIRSVANELEALTTILNLKYGEKKWNKENMTRLRDILQRIEPILLTKVDGQYWVETMPAARINHDMATVMLQEMSLIFPNFQYHRFLEANEAKRKAKEEALAEKEKRKAARINFIEPAEKQSQPVEKEKTYKDYWRGLTRDEQLAEISRCFTLIDEYCERMNAVVYKLERTCDPRFAEAAKILNNHIIQRFYFTDLEGKRKGKDMKSASNYVLVDEKLAYLRDKHGNVLLDERAMSNSVIKGFFEKFENLSHEFYKLNDLVGDVQLSDDEYTPIV